MSHLKRFIASETGAITVDWVVLTAAIVGLAMAVTVLVSGGISDVATEINSALNDDVTITTAFQ
ncbi:hypothetical protein P6F26_07310 [Roseibacterium sp. SDUM158017]|uniref:hypothetical protein n=1 Tax=Roseicyclus salinarum TaxID=3036773 RepID=UPI002415622E|nr:hypothetical protein [Roseibacterium sp. SDUM158017]MDG4648248.1 hypothetical protein [Roseibacterium sp. SDUM158017]